MKAPRNAKDAVTLALLLGLTAPTDAQAAAAAALAESLAANLSERDIKNCKRRALQRFRALRAGVQTRGANREALEISL